jgi:hypothetical protein
MSHKKVDMLTKSRDKCQEKIDNLAFVSDLEEIPI